MVDNTHNIPIVYATSVSLNLLTNINELIEIHNIPITLLNSPLESKLTQKIRRQLNQKFGKYIFILDDKQGLSLLVNGIQVAPNWEKLQRRVVTAGRKSELLLQACKLNDKNRVLDATAGFGHDSLILASTGARVTMLEKNPLLFLLLLFEQKNLASQNNWQKLMNRLTLRLDDACRYMGTVNLNSQSLLDSDAVINHDLTDATGAFDVVYLDPMFPENSYISDKSGKGAKVGKHMQALHQLAAPPDINEEKQLLKLALSYLKFGGRVVVKRPISAQPLGGFTAKESWQNDVVRFDAYFNE